ncbi:acyl carrier protein [Magnetovibrio blakemorei]|uniref:Carrier domain-containing protein n=1 Tax=Magnetovibrio blakemorei TaxID=28181 RepID=A0A1E5QBY4_9PROT|nr:hypothetical protein [Magnetovibrio blakemorei]OEJ69579.1 hypothetical protein BEN30_02580 [Magnetovibrio blakemorei]
MKDHLKTEIHEFITNYIHNYAAGENLVLDGSTNFVADRLLDSFAILNLIMTLESQYAVKFQAKELADPKLQTIEALAQIIFEKSTV